MTHNPATITVRRDGSIIETWETCEHDVGRLLDHLERDVLQDDDVVTVTVLQLLPG